jgi:hypothetical protein
VAPNLDRSVSEDHLKRDREVIDAALGSTGPKALHGEAMLTGWVVVCEWMDPQGERWLSKFASEGSTQWQIQGFMHHGLYESWQGDEEP